MSWYEASCCRNQNDMLKGIHVSTGIADGIAQEKKKGEHQSCRSLHVQRCIRLLQLQDRAHHLRCYTSIPDTQGTSGHAYTFQCKISTCIHHNHSATKQCSACRKTVPTHDYCTTGLHQPSPKTARYDPHQRHVTCPHPGPHTKPPGPTYH